MSANIKINIVAPGDPTPIDPVVPNTGLFTHGIGGPEATIITVSIVAIIAIVAAVLYYKKKHSKDNTANKSDKAEKATKLAKTISTLKTKKKLSIPLAALALVVSLGTLTALLVNAGKSNTSAAEGDTENSLTVTESSADLTIEVADTPVFAVLPVELTVEEATGAGYTLTAYTDNTDLVSTTDGSKVIPMVAAEEGELVALAEDTYGLALDNKPASKDNEVYTALSTSQDAPTVIKTIDDYSPTPAEDKTTIYYGFYITPDTPKGTYEGSVINYEAKENTATVVFDGNGKFYFDGDTAATTNTMNYIPGNNEIRYSHTPNVNDEGVQDGMYPLDSNETFVYEFSGVDNVYVDVVRTGNDNSCGPDSDDYFSIWSGAHSDYTAKANWETALSLAGSSGKNVFDNVGKYDGVGVNVDGDSATIAYTTSDRRDSWCVESGYGYYAKVIGYNPNIVTSGEYEKPTTDGAYRFLGWSEDKDATAPTYKTAADIERALSLTTGKTATLYAISEPGFVVSYNGNGADSTTNMDQVEQYTADLTSTNKQVDLLASNFTKSGHGFVGWSTDQNAWEDLTDDDESNNPTIYGPNQMITVDPSTSTKLILYAVWAPAETDNSGNPISLQDWQGCSSLTPTAYSAETGALTVGKNTITALTDARDGNIYTVARLADGNCWMTENLRLDNEPELSQQNTNNPSLPLTNNYAEQTTSNFLSATSNDWCTDWDSAPCYNQSKLNTKNTALTTASPAFSQDFTSQSHKDFDDSISSYSNYYNWYSATAGNGKQETTSTVAGDICPAGWILPIGNQTTANGSFSNLDSNMGGTGNYHSGSNNWRSFPNNFVYSGSWYGSSAGSRGYGGYYWSSTASSTYGAYDLYFYSGNVNPGASNGNKYSGYSVRCVAPVGTTITFDGNGNTGGEMSDQIIGSNQTAPLNSNRYIKDGFYFIGWNTKRDGSGTSYKDRADFIASGQAETITLYVQWEEMPYMQDVATWGSALSEGDTIQAIDKRDDKAYYVSRLADGNIWMTQNLDLDLNSQTALTPANTNITADWTPANSTIAFAGTTVDGWNNDFYVPYSADPGDVYSYSSGIDSYDTQYTSLEDCQAAHPDCNSHNHVGNYYNWSAAVANNDTSSLTEEFSNAEESICPAGWRLPTNATNADDLIANNEQDAWISTYEGIVQDPSSCGGTCRYRNYQEGGFNKIRTTPLWLVRSGTVWYGSLQSIGNGLYWSSTVKNSLDAYNFNFDPDGVYPTYGSNRGGGYSVRCVAE